MEHPYRQAYRPKSQESHESHESPYPTNEFVNSSSNSPVFPDSTIPKMSSNPNININGSNLNYNGKIQPPSSQSAPISQESTSVYHTPYTITNINNEPILSGNSPGYPIEHDLPSPPSNPLSTTSSFVNINQLQNINQFSKSETNLQMNLNAPKFTHNRSVSSTSSFFDRSDNNSVIDFGHNVLQQYLGDFSNNLLPRMKTIELYRKNAKKSNDPTVLFQYAQYMLQTALMMNDEASDLLNPNDIGAPNSKSVGNSPLKNSVDTNNINDNSIDIINLNQSNHKQSKSVNSLDYSTNSLPQPQSQNSNYDEKKLKKELLKEAIHYLRKLSVKGYVDAQYLLADAYSSGALGKIENREAFQLFQTAAKHGHIESAYRTSHSYEEGLGTGRDARKAIEFLKFAASKNHAAAMYKLGVYSFYSRMGLSNTITTKKMGIKWLTRATNVATELIAGAPYELGKIYFNGFEDIVIPDKKYALELYSQAAALNHIPSAALLGHYYEVGEIVPQDSNLSIHYYTQAAIGGEPESMLAMCAWYLVGNEPYLPKDDHEAFEWAKRAAINDLPKAQFALGHFYERGIGCIKNIEESQKWYLKASENGDEKAILRILDKEKVNKLNKVKKIKQKKSGTNLNQKDKKDEKDKDCIII